MTLLCILHGQQASWEALTALHLNPTPNCCRGCNMQAYKHVTDIRPCGPKRDAVRGATFDLLDGRPADAFAGLPSCAWASLSVRDRAALEARLWQR